MCFRKSWLREKKNFSDRAEIEKEMKKLIFWNFQVQALDPHVS